LKIALLELMNTPRVFRRNRFAPHPPSRPRCLCKPRRPSCMERAFSRGVLPGAFVWELELPSLQPTPNTHIYMSCMHYLAINEKQHYTTACCSSVPINPFFSFTRCRLTGACRVWSSRTKKNYRTSPGPDLATDTTPKHVPLREATMIRLLAAVLSPLNPFFHSVQTTGVIQTLALPNRK